MDSNLSETNMCISNDSIQDKNLFYKTVDYNES